MPPSDTHEITQHLFELLLMQRQLEESADFPHPYA